jgi:endoglucanase
MKKSNQKLVLYFSAFLVLLWSCTKNGEEIKDNENSVGTSGRALDQLAKGINLSNWLQDFSNKSEFGTRFTNAHFTQIKNAGFTYIRLPIGASVLPDPSNIAQMQTANLAVVDQAVKNITNTGLSVVIDMHAYTSSFESRLAVDPIARVSFRQFWKNLANYFKKYDTTQVFFEIWNEPHVGTTQAVAGIDKNWWAPFQGQIIQSIREAAPNHYIIAGAENFNNWYELTLLQPYTAKNIVYNFHFYDPFVFTHQGASWVGYPYDQLKQIPYPSSPQNVASLVASTPSTDLKNLISWHGKQQYNIDSINYVVRQVYNWSKQKNVPVICNEFGAYKPFISTDSRIRYMQDIRNTLAKYKMGWGIWEYDEGFGLASYPNSQRTGLPTWDQNMLAALGLN